MSKPKWERVYPLRETQRLLCIDEFCLPWDAEYKLAGKVPIQKAKCSGKCKRWLPVEAFAKNASKPRKRSTVCKKCSTANLRGDK